MRSRFVTGGVAVCCGVSVLVLQQLYQLYQELVSTYEQPHSLNNMENFWFLHLMLNLLGYCSVLVPGYILYQYIERTDYFQHNTSNSVWSRILYACFGSHERLPEVGKREDAAPLAGGAGGAGGAGAGAGGGVTSPDTRREALELMFCFTGLMGAYLVWGLLQEKIMVQEYVMSDGSVVRFSDAQFLVLVNRLCALLLAGARLRCRRRPLVAAPLYRVAYCSLTNIVSAWCQYEALKYVSFPTQVLSKSCKVIPVMLMGVLVSRNKYQMYEYVTAALISLGMACFMLGSHQHPANDGWVGTTVSGAGLLSLYMACDAFTASWQAKIFSQYKLTSLQMLCAVNICSCLLLHRAAFSFNSISMLQHGGFLADVVLLSASSALGQLLIYRTIARFGAVVFTIIMTLRQAVSILLSCIVYGHEIAAAGAAGILLVFAAVLLRLYCARRLRTRRLARAAPRPT